MFCDKCGKQVSDDAKFCRNCGTEIKNINTSPQTTGKDNKGLACPNCRSDDIYPISESNTVVSGGGYDFGSGCCGTILLGPIGLLCGFCDRDYKSESKTRHFWLCKKCGYKFRNAEDEKSEKYTEKKNKIQQGLITCVALLLIGIFFAFRDIYFIAPSWVYIVGGLIGGIVCTVLRYQTEE